MNIIQKLHLSFDDNSKKGIIIEQNNNMYIVMISHDGFYGTYSYVMHDNELRKFVNAKEVLSVLIPKWIEKHKLLKIETTNEFVKVEELENMFQEVEIKHV